MIQLHNFPWEGTNVYYDLLTTLKLCPNCRTLLDSGHCKKCSFDIDDPRTVGYASSKKIMTVLQEQERLDIDVTDTEITVKFPYQPWKNYILPYTLNSYESTRTGESEIVVRDFQVDYSSVNAKDLERVKEIDLRTRVLEYHYPDFTLQ